MDIYAKSQIMDEMLQTFKGRTSNVVKGRIRREKIKLEE
jgi:hypothetical protein